MSIRVALNHRTHYTYERPIQLGAQTIRLRPAAHSRTPICSYSLRVEPTPHYLNWQQDPSGNYLARIVFPQKVQDFRVEVDLVADLTVVNPFDFFLEPEANEIPFTYDASLKEELAPYLECEAVGPRTQAFIASVDVSPRRTIDFLVDINRLTQAAVKYVIRMEPGVQTPEETLERASGSCRDSAWLLVQTLRHLGFAARFTSGYLIQLKPDEKSLDGPSGTDHDFTDLHAWTEVYLPGAGWIGLDPTSGLLTGEGHIPLAATPSPLGAAPITGTLEKCDGSFDFSMSLTRVHEDPRVTLPYSDEAWQEIQSLGQRVDDTLRRADVRLTMGGEPTFVSIDDMEGEEWRTAALGPNKRRLAEDLLWRLFDRFGARGFLHYGQGKWYPGESLPRWAFRCYWRRDGEPIWRNPSLLARDRDNPGHTAADAERFIQALARQLHVTPEHATAAYEDVFYYMWKERRLPANVNLRDNKLENEEERRRLSRVFEQGITSTVGYALPIRYEWWLSTPRWCSGLWQVRSDSMFLIPGDSPMGFRLPLKSLIWVNAPGYPTDFFAPEPLAEQTELPDHAAIRQQLVSRLYADWGAGDDEARSTIARQFATPRARVAVGTGVATAVSVGASGNGDSHRHDLTSPPPSSREWPPTADAQFLSSVRDDTIQTALCIEPRQGKLHIFIPPLDRTEAYLELLSAIEATAEALQMPVVIEGYLPPHDDRLQHLSVTPDPGVIEVNVHPAANWQELSTITEAVYTDARQSRLGTEKFDLDGTHTGTGGGNHIVLGGARASDSPFLRRPDLLRSLLGYWHNHPSLSYLFSGRFIGPTSQAPRVDEGRRDALYELQIAFEQIPEQGTVPPWLVDRVFRHLLVDGTGNTHRAEFCIDKLFSPDSSAGRLGLVEFRAFEMPPHYRMSLTQQLLLRAMIARFWNAPYRDDLVNWNTQLHDRFMLPYFIWLDFVDVIEDMRQHGFEFESEWFAPHCEFRFPKIGEFTQHGVKVELRQAIEPWYVLGEEPAGGNVTRFVDSSVERLQVRVNLLTHPRFVLSCNGRQVPLHPTGTEGEYLAGIRYRAWQPPSCLHPTIPVDEPLVFDLYDTWLHRSLGGCRYHVGHPGGNNPGIFPVNSYEAESRRACRFFRMGHTPGQWALRPTSTNRMFPLTLDLRRGRWTQ